MGHMELLDSKGSHSLNERNSGLLLWLLLVLLVVVVVVHPPCWFELEN